MVHLNNTVLYIFLPYLLDVHMYVCTYVGMYLPLANAKRFVKEVHYYYLYPMSQGKGLTKKVPRLGFKYQKVFEFPCYVFTPASIFPFGPN